MKNLKDKGITLVALVITIIILLILVGISIATLTGSGLFEKARLAEQESKNKQEEEKATLDDYENIISEYISSNRATIQIDEKEYKEMKEIIKSIRNDKNNDTSELQDVAVSNTTYVEINPSSYNYLYYYVKNNICYVYYNINVVSTSSNWSIFTANDAIPRSSKWLQFTDKAQNSSNGGMVLGISNDGALRITPYSTGTYSGYFSYPI